MGHGSDSKSWQLIDNRRHMMAAGGVLGAVLYELIFRMTRKTVSIPS